MLLLPNDRLGLTYDSWPCHLVLHCLLPAGHPIRCGQFVALHLREEHSTRNSHSYHSSWGSAATKQAYKLLWNRTRNTRGGPGRSDPLDSHRDHLNRVLTDISTHFMHKSLRAVLKECTSIRADDDTTNSETAVLSLTEEEEGRVQ